MKQGNNVASKTNIITLNVLNKPKQVTSPKVLEQLEDDRLVNKFHDAVMTISNKVDIKGFALVAWDEKGTPCIAWDTGHNKNIISELMLPTFTQSCFQGIVNRKLSTPEDLKNE
jgi:hypothetical protein